MTAKVGTVTMQGEVHAEVPDSTAIVPIDQGGNVSVPALLQMAVAQLGGANPDAVVSAMERLVALQERIDEKAAVKAFNASLSKFQSECPPFKKGKLVDYTSKRTGTRVRYRYGELNEIREHIAPHLDRNYLSITWDVISEGGKDYSVCTASHVDGYSRSSKFPIIAESGNEKSFRSGAQEFASSETFAMRRAMIAVLGMTGYDPDVDGASREREESESKISREQANEIAQLLADTNTSEAKWCELYEVETVPELPASLYQKAVNQLKNKKAKAQNANS